MMKIQETKFSQFNSIVPFGDKFVLYNSFEDRVIFIENEHTDKITSFLCAMFRL